MRAGLFVTGLAYVLIATPLTLGLRRRATASNAETSLIDELSTAASDVSGLGQDIAAAVSAIASQLEQINRTSTVPPASAKAALSMIRQLFDDGQPNIVDAAHAIAFSGLVPADILPFLDGYLDDDLNSRHNQNPAPRQNIYPSKATGDAPYSTPEDTLRAAIYIPDSFSYGQNGRTPVILVPGTAIPAGTTYHYTFSKLGNTSPIDVVWVNLPRASLSDAQVNAEYVAYAINYISALCAGPNVAVISWSQGGLNTQWALKYWPSTRTVVKDLVAMSPDFHGTVVEEAICPAATFVICTPSIWQQSWEAEFIQTLRDDGGDSAYIPTTTVYSSFDELVEPMSGANASAILADERSVGVTNAHLQTVCAGQLAGGVYTHEGVLYNPLAWALAIDAITHEGPADLSRLDLAQVCQRELPPALNLEDLLGTEGILLVAVAELLAYRPQPTSEPPIKAYATHENGTRNP